MADLIIAVRKTTGSGPGSGEWDEAGLSIFPRLSSRGQQACDGQMKFRPCAATAVIQVPSELTRTVRIGITLNASDSPRSLSRSSAY